MNLLNKLTIKNLKLNKKRTVVTIIGIILSVALISALSSLVVSFQNSLIDYEKASTGNFHVSFSGLTEEDLSTLKDNRKIENVFFTKDIGYAIIEESKNEDKPYAFINAYDYESLENLGINLIEGRLPQTSQEIIIPRHLKTNGRVELKVGDTITLDIGERKTTDGYDLDQSNPYNSELETLENITPTEYKIVGIIERPSTKIEPYSAPGYTFITCLDKNEPGKYNAYVRFTKKGLKDYARIIANILGVDEELYLLSLSYPSFETEAEYDEYMKQIDALDVQLSEAKLRVTSTNNVLIALEGGSNKEASVDAIIKVSIVIVLIIITTSVFCIKNSFNISITEKTKQYGMLASIGATKKQIKQNVLYEALILGLIGIPIGILSGLLASYILIMICNYLLGEVINISLRFAISLVAIILSIILGSLTIYLSAIRSARKAAKITPITAIRNNDDIKIKSNKLKSPKLLKKIFGIGGEVSYKNLKRNNKKYRTTVISIVVCVSIFIALYSFMNLSFKTVEMQYSEQNYNISISLNGTSSDEFNNIKKQLLSIEGIEKYSILRYFYFTMQNPPYTEEYINLLKNPFDDSLPVDIRKEVMFVIYAVGEEEYNSYLNKLGLKSDKFVNKAILINNEIAYVYDETSGVTRKSEVPFFNYNIKDTINGEYYIPTNDEEVTKNEYEFELGFITYERPLGLEGCYGTPYLIISDEMYDELYSENKNHNIYLMVDNADDFQDEVELILESQGNLDYYIYNTDQEARSMKSMFTLIAIFLYGFITVIALIGITNIFNTITTNMELRSREFAMLKSIGMTKKEFNRMISLESILYGTKSLLFGIPIGCVLSYIIYRLLMNGEFSFAYPFPVLAIIISICAVYLLVICIMKYSISKINRQNTIETIRNDNI